MIHIQWAFQRLNYNFKLWWKKNLLYFKDFKLKTEVKSAKLYCINPPNYSFKLVQMHITAIQSIRSIAKKIINLKKHHSPPPPPQRHSSESGQENIGGTFPSLI
jgi:hypothetical protein